MTDCNVVFPRRLLKKFIVLYKELPCLWDREHPAYKIKMKRHDAITKLTELVQEFDSGATRVHVLRKIESLRACARREFKRVQESRRKATSEDEIYTPHLWYYDIISFVFKYEENEFKFKDVAGSPEQTAVSDDDEDEHFDASTADYSNEYNAPNNMVEVGSGSPITKQYLNIDEDHTKTKRQFTEVEDEYDAIGINVAAKLRYLPPNMRVLAEKLINDVLFQAQVNGLTPSTSVSTPDPFKQDVN